jgi:phosphate-selective porin OprO/OprP
LSRRRRARRAVGTALLSAALLAAAEGAGPRRAAAQEGWPPRLRFGDAFTLRPQGILQFDLGTTFDQNRPGGPGGGLNPRRARLGVEGEFLGDFEYTVLWDFGGVPGERNRLFEASVSYRGLDPVTVAGGAFEPSFSLQQERDAAGLLFFERATVVRAVSRLGAGSGRIGAEARANGERWFASAALTGGRVGPGADGSQRGAVARVAGQVVQAKDLVVHLGLSGTWSFRPPRGEDGERTVTFSENTELSLDLDNPLDTGPIRADAARAGGVEFGAS